MDTLTLEKVCKITEFNVLKFVKIGASLVFISVSDNNISHLDLVSPDEHNNVKGAGTVEIYKDKWNFRDRKSFTLGKVGINNNFVTKEIEDEITEEMRKNNKKYGSFYENK